MMRAVLFPLLAAITVLSGCGSDTESFPVARQLQSIAKEKLAKTEPSAQPAPVTRALLSQVVSPVQLVTIERFEKQALVAEIARNRGVETWSTVDDVTLSTRDGVLVATRGLGDDLMSAAIPSRGQLSAGGSTLSRRYVHLNGLDQTVNLTMTCKTSAPVSEAIEIVEKVYSTRRVDETCEANGQSIQNSYWWDGSGKLRKSRQWVSPKIGSILIEDLRG